MSPHRKAKRRRLEFQVGTRPGPVTLARATDGIIGEVVPRIDRGHELRVRVAREKHGAEQHLYGQEDVSDWPAKGELHVDSLCGSMPVPRSPVADARIRTTKRV